MDIIETLWFIEFVKLSPGMGRIMLARRGAGFRPPG
jgi:hypothetical protein